MQSRREEIAGNYNYEISSKLPYPQDLLSDSRKMIVRIFINHMPLTNDDKYDLYIIRITTLRSRIYFINNSMLNKG